LLLFLGLLLLGSLASSNPLLEILYSLSLGLLLGFEFLDRLDRALRAFGCHELGKSLPTETFIFLEREGALVTTEPLNHPNFVHNCILSD
jgi:hypothetical protein